MVSFVSVVPYVDSVSIGVVQSAVVEASAPVWDGVVQPVVLIGGYVDPVPGRVDSGGSVVAVVTVVVIVVLVVVLVVVVVVRGGCVVVRGGGVVRGGCVVVCDGSLVDVVVAVVRRVAVVVVVRRVAVVVVVRRVAVVRRVVTVVRVFEPA